LAFHAASAERFLVSVGRRRLGDSDAARTSPGPSPGNRDPPAAFDDAPATSWAADQRFRRHGEFFSADPAKQIGTAALLPKDVCKLLDHLVARLVAEGVVDLLEQIGSAISGPSGRRYRDRPNSIAACSTTAAASKPRQRVIDCELFELVTRRAQPACSFSTRTPTRTWA
jgi:hypothetical protein